MYVIYRSWNQGTAGKSVRHLAEPTVLDWVRSVWSEASAQDAYDWLLQELGTNVYGLDQLFSEGGPAPETMQDLRTLARTRLPEVYQCNVDEHSVRVLANGLDHDVAYYLVDDVAVAAHPERWSFAVHDGPLPDDVGPEKTTFKAPLQVVELAEHPPSGEGTVFAVLLTFKALRDCIGWNPTHALPGVRLPQFGAALRDLDVPTEEWPLELEVLPVLVAPGEEGVRPALERCNRWPDYSWNSGEQPHPPPSHDAAVRLLETGHRERTVIRVGEHLAQMFINHGRDLFDQWFFFDDRWAGANPDLAASLIWFAYHWDPLCSRHHMLHTPCSDNRVRYVAVVGDDGGTIQVREALPHDDPRIWDLHRWSYQKRPPGEVTAGEVLGSVEIQLRQPSPDMCKFTEFEITRTRHGQAVAGKLARHIRQDLLEAGIRCATGWLPKENLYPHGRRFLRMLGRLDESFDGPSSLFLA
ncbi:hypothetical protein HD597_010258 [Nonomuraea thailandensis]|uniref:Uncharacterized protein n=1 Tax=Nonomuraea thailandensis TaxID=1188745 RepID=A0A9X2GZJ7_9ACTN|nr:hypothetical protein [Nonomuraea thailandensis]MCP2363238.1 hypothetical protein [Nonomuraea thailandensis]